MWVFNISVHTHVCDSLGICMCRYMYQNFIFMKGKKKEDMKSSQTVFGCLYKALPPHAEAFIGEGKEGLLSW